MEQGDVVKEIVVLNHLIRHSTDEQTRLVLGNHIRKLRRWLHGRPTQA